MIYTKPQVEIVKFDAIGFMTASGGFASKEDFVASYGIDWNGNSAFKCSGFGNCGNSVGAPDGGTFTQNHGGNWKYNKP